MKRMLPTLLAACGLFVTSLRAQEESATPMNWSEVAETEWYGDGSDASYTISTSEQLAGLAKLVNEGITFEGKTITLTANIDLAGREWTPVGNGRRSGNEYTGAAFKGTFAAGTYTFNAKTIAGLTIKTGEPDAAIGLFGVLDGGTVRNLNLEEVNLTASSEQVGGAVGLMVANATVQGVTLKSGRLEGKQSTGGIVGRMIKQGAVKSCYNNGATVSVVEYNAGGIVGTAYYDNEGMSIASCTNKGNVSGPTSVGGIVGFSVAEVTSCTNSGVVTGSGSGTGGIAGEQQNAGSVTNCTNNGAVKGASYVGGIVGWVRYSGLDTVYPNKATIAVTGNTNSGAVEGAGDYVAGVVGRLDHKGSVMRNKNTATSITGPASVAGLVGAAYDAAEEAVILGNLSTTPDVPFFNGNVAQGAFNFTDKEGDNLSIATFAEFKAFLDVVKLGVTFEGKTVTLTADIDLTGQSFSGIPSTFAGTLKGQRAGTEGFTLDPGRVGADTRVQITIKGVTNAFCSGMKETTVIENIRIEGEITNGYGPIGGFVSSMKHGTLRNCTNAATVTSTASSNGKAGGFAGHAYAGYRNVIAYCTNEGRVSGAPTGNGGIVGYGDGYSTVIQNCLNIGAVGTDDRTWSGGIVGWSTKTKDGSADGAEGLLVENCRNEGTIVAKEHAGGIMARMMEPWRLSGSTNAGTVTCLTGNAAGIAGGVWGGTITGCANEAAGTITGKYAGGVAGSLVTATIVEDSTNAGKVTSNIAGGAAGGIVASVGAASTLKGCTNTAEVEGGVANAGGIVGSNGGQSLFEACENSGAVSSGATAGGIVGAGGSATLKACANNAKVGGGTAAGGVVGTLSSKGVLDGCAGGAAEVTSGTDGAAGRLIGSASTGSGEGEAISLTIDNGNADDYASLATLGKITGSAAHLKVLGGTLHGELPANDSGNIALHFSEGTAWDGVTVGGTTWKRANGVWTYQTSSASQPIARLGTETDNAFGKVFFVADEALAAATDGSTVTLYGDVTLRDTVTLRGNITLDLNDHTLYAPDPSTPAFTAETAVTVAFAKEGDAVKGAFVAAAQVPESTHVTIEGLEPLTVTRWTDKGAYDIAWFMEWYNDESASMENVAFALTNEKQFAGLAWLLTAADAADYRELLSDIPELTITLTADIDLSALLWVPAGTFVGKLDGAGHTLSGLRTQAALKAGLFEEIAGGAVVEALRISSATLNVKTPSSNKVVAYGGAFAAKLSGGLSRCVAEKVTFESVNANGLGGFAGQAMKTATVENCLVAENTIPASKSSGTFVGVPAEGMKVTNCLSLSPLNEVVAENAKAVLSNVYARSGNTFVRYNTVADVNAPNGALGAEAALNGIGWLLNGQSTEETTAWRVDSNAAPTTLLPFGVAGVAARPEVESLLTQEGANSYANGHTATVALVQNAEGGLGMELSAMDEVYRAKWALPLGEDAVVYPGTSAGSVEAATLTLGERVEVAVSLDGVASVMLAGSGVATLASVAVPAEQTVALSDRVTLVVPGGVTLEVAGKVEAATVGAFVGADGTSSVNVTGSVTNLPQGLSAWDIATSAWVQAQIKAANGTYYGTVAQALGTLNVGDTVSLLSRGVATGNVLATSAEKALTAGEAYDVVDILGGIFKVTLDEKGTKQLVYDYDLGVGGLTIRKATTGETAGTDGLLVEVTVKLAEEGAAPAAPRTLEDCALTVTSTLGDEKKTFTLEKALTFTNGEYKVTIPYTETNFPMGTSHLTVSISKGETTPPAGEVE